MLSPAERDLVARDEDLPGLALLLETDRLADRLGLARDRLCDPYLRYKPRTSCVLALHLDGPERTALAVTAHSPNHYAIVRARPKWRKGLEQVIFLDDACLVAVPMALDRKLRGLSALAHQDRRDALLARTSGMTLPATPAIKLLRYNPGRRAVLRLDGPEGPVALAKMHAADEWPRALEGARLADALGGARLLGVAEKERLLLFSWVEGRPLWPDGGEPPSDADLEAIGAALARLHQATPRLERRTGPREETEELASAAAAVGFLMPALRERADDLARATGAALAGSGRQPALIHGDFSADQVVLTPTGPVLIDWDRAAMGDPARDLASFLARLDAHVVDGLVTGDEAARARRALLAGYGRQAPIPATLDAQRARALLALAPEGFRRRRPDWPERAKAILDRVEALLPSRDPAACDPFADILMRARDLRRAGPLVAAALGRPARAVQEAELLRLKTGRRALIRYVLADATGSTAALGKLRARDTDRRTPALHAALRGAGLDGAGPHRVGVPRALGQVDELRLWLQEEVPGRRIADHLHPDAGTRAAAQAGQALARLHACAVPAQRRWTLADEAEVLGRTLEEAARALPSDAVRIRRLAALGTELTSRLGPGPEAFLHRDWHPDQALLEGETVWILDLDLHARGDPAIDLGNFVAHVAELAIRRHGDVGRLADHERAFLDGYADGGGRADRGRVGALKALSLARLFGISLRLPDRQAATRAILDAAERLVADALRTCPGRVEPESPVRAGSAMASSDQVTN